MLEEALTPGCRRGERNDFVGSFRILSLLLIAVPVAATEATFKAIKALFPHEARLQLFQVNAVTAGTDAQAEVTVRLEEEGKTVNGQGADTDTLVASCKAYLHALNKLLVKRQKTAPAALSA